jgi:chaperonin GroES
VLSRDGGKHASAIKITSNTFKYIETRVIEMAKVNLRPLDDRVVVQPLEAEETTAGGIVFPYSAKEKPQRGKGAALSVSVGDEVIFGKYGGSEVEVDGVEYKILRESDVLAKLA